MSRLVITAKGSEVRFAFFKDDEIHGQTIATALPGFEKNPRMIIFNDPGMALCQFESEEMILSAPGSTIASIKKGGIDLLREWFPFLPADTEFFV